MQAIMSVLTRKVSTAKNVNLRIRPHRRPALALPPPLHTRHDLLHHLQNPVALPQSADLPVLVLNSTLSAEALRTSDHLRHLVFVLSLGPRKQVSVNLVALFSKTAQRLHRQVCFEFQRHFQLVSLGATALEAVAELAGAGVVLAAEFA